MGTNVAYTNEVPVGATVTVAVEGDFLVQPAASVTKGQKVFASLTTGAVSGGAAGANVSGSIETNWVFDTSADAGEIAIITNHGQTPFIPAGE
jgi:outer membrane lipoprotein SlyB